MHLLIRSCSFVLVCLNTLQYSSQTKVMSHSLDILSTLTAIKSRNRSDNKKLRHRIQLCRQILSASMISSFESSISCPCSILDTTYKMKLITITLEGKVISSILKDFLARYVMLIQINNRSRDFNKGEHNAGHNRA